MADFPVGREAGFGLVRGQRRVSRNEQSDMEGRVGWKWLLRRHPSVLYLTVGQRRHGTFRDAARSLALFALAKVNKAGQGQGRA